MTNELSKLNPSEVWRFFSDICAIPHVSGNEQRIGDYLVDFAVKSGLSYSRSECGNVIISRPSSVSMADRPAILLQAHMDMVGVKKDGLDFNFATDSITPIITEDGYVTASGTTLGADDGIGVAMILAILADRSAEYPAIEGIFTVSEETSMLGAEALIPTDIKADFGINIDSEDLGEVCIGCAGGTTYTVNFQPEISDVPNDFCSVLIELSRGTGGHSGMEADKGRINTLCSALALVGVLAEEGYEANLSSIKGGTVRNSIPTETTIVLSMKSDIYLKALSTLNDIADRIKTRFAQTDPNLTISISKVETANIMFSYRSTQDLVHLRKLNTRVIERTEDGQPLTSCNLGVIEFTNGLIVMKLLARFATAEGKELIDKTINALVEDNNAQIADVSSYSFWEPNYNSRMLALASDEYKNMTGSDVKCTVIHAGLECGLFKNLNPKLDIISVGPNVFGAHSVNERVEINSVETCYNWIKNIIKSVK